jgi:hypothetical protein
MSTETTASSRDTGLAPPHSFVKHTTTNPAPVHPFIDTSLPPINVGAPIELDSTPVSPVARKESWKVRTRGTVTGPGADQEVYEQLSGEAGANKGIRQVRYHSELG